MSDLWLEPIHLLEESVLKEAERDVFHTPSKGTYNALVRDRQEQEDAKREDVRPSYQKQNAVGPRTMVHAALAENRWDVDLAVNALMQHWEKHAKNGVLPVKYAFRLGRKRFDSLPLDAFMESTDFMVHDAFRDAAEPVIFQELDMDEYISTYTARGAHGNWECEIVFPKPKKGEKAPQLLPAMVEETGSANKRPRANRQLDMDEGGEGPARKQRKGPSPSPKGKGKQPMHHGNPGSSGKQKAAQWCGKYTKFPSPPPSDDEGEGAGGSAAFGDHDPDEGCSSRDNPAAGSSAQARLDALNAAIADREALQSTTTFYHSLLPHATRQPVAGSPYALLPHLDTTPLWLPVSSRDRDRSRHQVAAVLP